MTGVCVILGRMVLLAMGRRKGNALRRDVSVPSEISGGSQECLSVKHPDKNVY